MGLMNFCLRRIFLYCVKCWNGEPAGELVFFGNPQG